MNIRKKIIDHLFIYTIVLCIIISIVVASYRFVIENNYMVYYESECDPYTETCFKSCEDSCTYYVKVKKHAQDVFYQCGKDITDCELASICLQSDRECSVMYCDSKVDSNCESITNSDILLDQIITE